eukprot:2943825-Rhodomonas_salina.1
MLMQATMTLINTGSKPQPEAQADSGGCADQLELTRRKRVSLLALLRLLRLLIPRAVLGKRSCRLILPPNHAQLLSQHPTQPCH